MSYAHQGPANVVISQRHFGRDPVDVDNLGAAVTLGSAGQPNVARLEFAHALRGPTDANYVTVSLPSGLQVGGSIIQGGNNPDGSGWLTFGVEETDLGLKP